MIPDDQPLFDVADMPGTIGPETGMGIPGLPGHGSPRNGHSEPQVNDTPCLPGQMRPRNGQSPPRAGVVWAFDWSTNRGISAVDPGGRQYRPRTLLELLNWVPPGSVVVGESTFESYDLTQRGRVIEYAESRGIALLTVPARGNTWRRAKAGLPEKTSQSKQTDFEDAIAIQQAVYRGAHLKKPSLPDPGWEKLRGEAARRFVELRYSGKKDDYARGLTQRLPPFLHQPIERRIALGPKGGYNAVIVAAVGVAAEFVTSRRDFERLTGLCAHGYPCQFRSDLMHWGWGRQPLKRERISLSVYRRELRWLFHQLRE